MMAEESEGEKQVVEATEDVQMTSTRDVGVLQNNESPGEDISGTRAGGSAEGRDSLLARHITGSQRTLQGEEAEEERQNAEDDERTRDTDQNSRREKGAGDRPNSAI